MKAKYPGNEDERQRALDSYQILDTESEEAYDDFTFLASQICETPIALISLIDKERQWFKSKVGLNVDETSRDLAFCAHAILKNEVLVVPDATRDNRFADNLLVLEDPKIRFYAGAPLYTPDGFNLGTLCVIDRAPRQIDKKHVASLNALSRQIVAQLELKKALSTITTLSGLLPICSYCKQIRDNNDSWHGLESYITEHSDAEFSHSVCPSCHEEKVIPDLDALKKSMDESSKE